MSGVTPQSVFGTLREFAPELNTYKKTVSWQTSTFEPGSRVPDELTSLTLPGVSPFARGVAARKIGAAGQIPIKELTAWYIEQNPEGSKATESEWKAARQFVKTTGRDCKGMSTKSRASSSRNRSRIQAHLELKKDQTKANFEKRVDEVAAARTALKKCLAACVAEHEALTKQLEKAEMFAASRFDWPLVVNNQCMMFREQRIGIDKVLDTLEIELLKENEMLRTTATEQFDEPVHQTKNMLMVLQECIALLEADIARKVEAELLDTKLSTLVSSKTLQVNLDIIQTRPITGIEMSEWRQSSENLIEGTYKFIVESTKLRKKLLRACSNTDKLMKTAQSECGRTMQKAMGRAEAARDEVQHLLEEVKREAMTTEQEVTKLEKLISLQETPLKRATTQLFRRSMRPDGEQTNDSVHDSLIQEVADLDNAVSALTQELDISIKNLDELRNLEGLLEEDFAIKKNTLLLETRCTKARAFLSTETDPFTVKKMMREQKFFDLMTR